MCASRVATECHKNCVLCKQLSKKTKKEHCFLCKDLDGKGVEDRKADREGEEPDIKRRHRSVVSTHADPSNSSQMQVETPGGAGVSCPCERRATVELKPKTDTGGFVCSKMTGMQPFYFPFPHYPTGFTTTILQPHVK